VQTYSLRRRFYSAFATLVGVVALCNLGSVLSEMECRRQIERMREFQRSASAALSEPRRAELESLAEQASGAATRTTAHGVPIALAPCLLVAAFAFGLGRNLWRTLADPFARLRDAALHVGQGETAARVGALRVEELAAIGSAFDSMLDALAANRRSLLEAERLAAMGRVAAGVAHEINNPIGIIRGYLKTMRRDASSGQLSNELAILDEEAAACQRIADDLLACAAPVLHCEAVDMAEVIEESIGRAQNREPAFSNRVQSHVERAVLRVDPLRVRQVVTNLVRNALEASPPEASVDVEGRLDGAVYRIEVADRGPGIPAEARAQVFEPFFTTRRGGTGLGLAVCRALVSAHGGSIAIDDREGGGLHVVVELPPHLKDP
jgi:signal transduction histidine kinase